MLTGFLLIVVLLTAHGRSIPPAAVSAASPAAPASAEFEQMAHLGGVAGQGFAVAAGGATVYIAQGGQITVIDASDPAAPVRLASIGGIDGAQVAEMLVAGSTLYVLRRAEGLSVFDVSNPAAPLLRGSYAGKTGLTDMVLAGTQAFLGYHGPASGILVLNVSNPASPTLLRDFALPCWVTNQLDLAGTTLYATTVCGLQIINVSNPANPVIVGSYPGTHAGVAVSNGVAYTTDNYTGYKSLPFNTFRAINVSNPANPVLLHESSTHGTSIGLWRLGQSVFAPDDVLNIINLNNPAAPAKQLAMTLRDLDLSGTAAYALDNTGLTIFDVSAPAAPVSRGGYTLIGDVTGMRVVGSTLYTFGLTGVQVVDIANPQQPQILGQYRAHSITDIEVAGSLIYASGRDFRIIDASNPLSPTLLSIITDTFSVDIELAGDFAYLGNQTCAALPPWNGGCQSSRASHVIVDVSVPAAPQIVKRHEYPTNSASSSFVHAIEVDGGWLYGALYGALSAFNIVAGTDTINPSDNVVDFEIAGQLMVAGSHITQTMANNLTIYDISDPQSLTALGSLRLPIFPSDVEISGTMAYVAGGFTDYAPNAMSRLDVVSVDDPTQPALFASYAMSSRDASDVEVAGDLVFVAKLEAGLEILRYHGPTETVGTLTPAGGSLSSSDGALTLSFPAGAVSEPVALSLLQFRAPPHPLGLRERAVQTFRLTATGPDGALPALAQPYALTLDYTPAQLAARGIPAATLELAAWSGGAWQSVPACPGCSLNQAAHRMTASSSSLGMFALRGRPFQAILPLVRR